MATSTKKNGVWSAWSKSKIKGEDGKGGIDGIAKFKSTVFIKSIGTPAIPTGGE